VLDLSSAELRFTTHRGFDKRLDISHFLPIRKRRTRSMAEGSNKKLFAQSEVALHASRKDCWVVISGKAGAIGDIFFVIFLARQGTDLI
jgi:cytochrome b involved in lipid metabolism